MNKTSAIYANTSPSTFATACVLKGIRGQINLRDELDKYGLSSAERVRSPLSAEPGTSYPSRRGAYFTKAPMAAAIGYYPVPPTGEGKLLSGELLEVRTKDQIDVSLREILAMFFSRRVGSEGNKESCSAWLGIPGTMAAVRNSGARSRAQELVQHISTFATLRRGWNSYSAIAPTDLAIENAKTLVTTSSNYNIIPERVEPSAMRGVGVTFLFGQHEVAIEYYNSGKAHALFARDATGEMTTRPVRTDSDGCRELVEEVHKHLYGKPLDAPASEPAFFT